MILVIDTREQRPLKFPRSVATMPGTLATGDYLVKGLERIVSIERKSLPDLLMCCGRERERFEKEIMRLKGYPIRAVIVEATWEDLEAGEWRSQISPAVVLGSIQAWMADGVQFVLAGNRQRAARIVYGYCRRAYNKAQFALRDVQPGKSVKPWSGPDDLAG